MWYTAQKNTIFVPEEEISAADEYVPIVAVNDVCNTSVFNCADMYVEVSNTSPAAFRAAVVVYSPTTAALVTAALILLMADTMLDQQEMIKR